MKNKKVKGYWEKRSEKFADGSKAKNRASKLRMNDNISHVTVDKDDGGYVVSYSIAKWYLEELRRAGVEL